MGAVVFVGGTAVAVGGNVFVGGTAVAVGGRGVQVGRGVKVGAPGHGVTISTARPGTARRSGSAAFSLGPHGVAVDGAAVRVSVGGTRVELGCGGLVGAAGVVGDGGVCGGSATRVAVGGGGLVGAGGAVGNGGS